MFSVTFVTVLVGCVVTLQINALPWAGLGSKSWGADWGKYSSKAGYESVFGKEKAEWGCEAYEKNCAPIVVRPQELPRPITATQVGVSPLPGPCACKKAIVKPAVLPKPPGLVEVDVEIKPEFGLGFNSELGFGGVGVLEGNLFNSYNLNKEIKSASSHVGCGLVGGEIEVGRGIEVGGYKPVALEERRIYNNAGSCAPADAVSLALAYEAAQRQHQIQNEDRLAFGFRSIPVELPKQVIRRTNNVPEEGIFNLNGQIVELKPVQVTNVKNIEEEAAEDLVALEEEEAAAIYDEAAPIRTVTLGEIGYAPAKIENKPFIDVEIPDVAEIGIKKEHICKNTMPGFISGNVEYRTVPRKGQPIIVHTPGEIDDCESDEREVTLSAEEEAYDGKFGLKGACGMCCAPCCSKHSVSSSSLLKKKANVLIEKLYS